MITYYRSQNKLKNFSVTLRKEVHRGGYTITYKQNTLPYYTLTIVQEMGQEWPVPDISWGTIGEEKIWISSEAEPFPPNWPFDWVMGTCLSRCITAS